MSHSAAPPAPTAPSTPLLWRVVWIPAGALFLLVSTAPLVWTARGPARWAFWLLAVVAALVTLGALGWLAQRHRDERQALTRALAEQAGQVAAAKHSSTNHHQRWEQYAAGLTERHDLTVAALGHLFGEQLPAALRGHPVPAGRPGFDRALGRDLVAARDAAFSEVGAARAASADELESQRLTLVALARKVQSAMHRVQQRAEVLAERHRDQPEIYTAGQNLDHLAAQAARVAQRLAVMCGSWEGQQWDAAMRLAEVVQAACARIEDYARISIVGDPEIAVEPVALEPTIHAVAELLANAAESSPTGTAVEVRVSAAAAGAVIRIDDQGNGLEEPRLSRAQELVAGRHQPSLAEVGEVPCMGLPVVGRLATRHGLQVTLESSPYGGLRAVVLVPQALVVDTVPRGGTAVAPSSADPSPPEAPAADPAASGPGADAAPRAGGLPQRTSRRDERPAPGTVQRPAPPVRASDETPEQAGAFLGAALSGLPGPGPDAPAEDRPSTPPLDRQGETPRE